jgi:hypothetical protein
MNLTTHLHLVPRSKNEWRLPPLPNTPSWRGAQLKHRNNFTFTSVSYNLFLILNKIHVSSLPRTVAVILQMTTNFFGKMFTDFAGISV